LITEIPQSYSSNKAFPGQRNLCGPRDFTINSPIFVYYHIPQSASKRLSF